MTPVIIINAKTYPEATGEQAQHLIEACAAAAEDGVDVGLALQAFDLQREGFGGAKRYAQHLDVGTPGKRTGYLLVKNAKALGVDGTILNHSEHKLAMDVLKDAVAECKEQGLTTIVCADTPDEAKTLSALEPSYIALEPPELIGGDTSVSEAQPQIITEGKKAVGEVPLLVGAGIKTRADVTKALELGACGVLVASGVVKAPDQEGVIRSFSGS